MSNLDEGAVKLLVTVKPLEWVWNDRPYFTWSADSIVGSYRAWEIDGTSCVIRPDDRSGVIVGATTDEAKAAAQSDYAQRILSTLSPAADIPSPGSGWQDIASAPKDGTWLDLWAGDRRVPDVRWAENEEPDEYGFTGGWVNVKGQFALGEDEPPMFWMRVERPSPANPAETQAGEVGK